ncbi:cystatin-M [Perognathus longimembris pacificus]|uniref:cystatin-M n=1 Tax=Perognathus longimembris pacificus TaxID=214514 RepID=UPI00201938D2|nr:cystatin-M [Perognathus longimembris pacificus]
MARAHLPLAVGLALLAVCLLAPCPGARAEFRGRRTGERRDVSPQDPQVQKAAQMAVATYNMDSNSISYYRNTNIVRAQTQMVAGIKYYLTMDMESTECRKNMVYSSGVDLTTCPLATGVEQERLRCEFEILEVPWKNSSQLLKQNCVQM